MIFKTSVLAALALLASTATAHVSMSTPCSRFSPAAGCPAPPAGQSIDYDINSPIGTHDTINAPICKHTTPYGTRTTYKAGDTINVKFSIGASHGGGNCQFAISYDQGKTFAVIQTVLRTCLQGTTAGDGYSIPVTIPASAPSGQATFMWLWNNAIGNRELYSNCADLTIQGSASGSITGLEPLYANYGPSSPLIPEFPVAADDNGAAFYAARKPITITANGSGNPAPPQATTTTAAPKPTTTTGAPKPTTTSAAPKPTTTSAASKPTTTSAAPKPTTTTAKPPKATVIAPKPTKVAANPAPAPPASSSCPAWSASQVYVGGNKVTYNGQTYAASWWTEGEIPGTTGEWGVWKVSQC